MNTAPEDEKVSAQDVSLKKANRRLAIVLGVVASILALWPLYILRQGLGS